MKLAETLRNRKHVLDHQLRRKDVAELAARKLKWDAAVLLATSQRTQAEIVDKANSWRTGTFRFDVMDSRNVENKNGGGHYDIPLNGGGNMFCAIRDGKVSQSDLFEWYPPFADVANFYRSEGFVVTVQEASDGCGMEDWLVLEISLKR